MIRRMSVAALAAALLTGAFAASAPNAGAATVATSRFTQLPPTRVVDTRVGLGGTTGPVRPDTTFDVQIAGVGGVPAGASAVAVNLTVVEAVRAGYVTLYPAGGENAGSNVNPGRPGETIANMAIVALPASGRLSVFAQSGGHILLDVAGYWTPATSAKAGRYVSVTPDRVLDTRDAARAKIGPQGTVNARVVGRSVPAEASAVAVTVTAVDATSPGFITVWAAGQPRPDASISNQNTPGATVPNVTIVPVGANGEISIFTYGGAHILVDVAGWFTGDASAQGAEGLFVPVTPTRIADTRGGTQLKKLAAGLAQEMPVRIPGDVPAGLQAAAIAVNLTVADTLDDGYLTASPSLVPVPNASNLNYGQSKDVAGLALTRLGANGNINLFSYATAHVIADIAGWFTGAPAADQGYRPTRCENLMQFRKYQSEDLSSVMIDDRTQPSMRHAVASGSLISGRIAQRCEYITIFRFNEATNTSSVSRIDVLGTQPERVVIGNLDWDTQAPSSDGNSWFFSTGGGVEELSNTIKRLDMRTGVLTTVYQSAGKDIYDVSDSSSDGRYLFFTARMIGGFSVYQLDLTTGTAAPVTDPKRFVIEYDRTPDGTGSAQIELQPDGVTSMFVIGPANLRRIGVYRVRFTPQGELVESQNKGPVYISTAPFENRQVLLDNDFDFHPNFPKFALRP